MTKIELHRLAGALATLRPEWPPASLQTFLERHFAHRPLRDAAVVLVSCALDPATSTPARVLEAGPWWKAAAADRGTVVPTVKCPTHYVEHAGTCPACRADQLAGHAETADAE